MQKKFQLNPYLLLCALVMAPCKTDAYSSLIYPQINWNLGIKSMWHQPYSLDLTPCKWLLFLAVKEEEGGGGGGGYNFSLTLISTTL